MCVSEDAIDKSDILESPRSGALFKICNPQIATGLAMLCTPHQIKRLRQQRLIWTKSCCRACQLLK